MPPAPDPTDWRTAAACQHQNPAWWYPEHRRNPTARQALAICAGCPVQDPCLEWALAVREPYGIWGGRTEAERRRELTLRERRLAAR